MWPFIFCAAVLSFAAGGARSLGSPRQAASPAPAPAATETVPQLTDGVVHAISPSDADSQIKRFTANNLALFKNDVAKNANLLVFFPPTGGTPAGGWPFIEAGVKAGYRVIGLMYDNATSDPGVCGPNPDPACSDRFRQKRIYGDDATKDIDDLPAESVVNRLTKFLEYLDAHHHNEGWGRYLRDGKPEWSRIAVAGHSQGAGVAAYIAKKEKVARVIVLSGAWDRTETTKAWAPWVTSSSATPLDRWYAAYHEKETSAAPIKAAYEALRIPPDHVRAMTLEPNPQYKGRPGGGAYHMSMASTVATPVDANGNPAYAADWAFFLGMPN
jgi:predicted esterase